MALVPAVVHDAEQLNKGNIFKVDWETPHPLPTLPSVETFDPVLMPNELAPWIADMAKRMQSSIDYGAIGAMVSLSSVIGTQVRVKPKRNDDWLITPNLWVLLLADQVR